MIASGAMLNMDPINTVRIGGLDTIVETRKGLAERMVADCRAARVTRALPKLVFSSNGQGISLCAEDPKFAEVMRQADIVHADGMSVVFASRLLTNTPIPERAATTDLFHDAAEAAIAAGLKFYMLGGKEEQNLAAYEAALRMYPKLQIVGRHHGYFAEADNERICAEVRASGADVLWVALGKPRQEFWSYQNRQHLAGVGWIKTCGGLYAFLAGDAPRAPRWMQALSLEWAFRLIKEPSRLGLRYLATNPHAMYVMLRDRLVSGAKS